MDILNEYTVLAEFAESCKKSYLSVYEEMKANAGKIVYSSGGQGVHRGYYCPSPTVDIVVGNAGRGKLLARLTSKSKPSYKYYFDNNGRLTAVDNFTELGKNTELIYTNGVSEKSIEFDDSGEIILLSQCCFSDGKIISYHKFAYSGMFSTHNIDDIPYMDFSGEEYVYDELGLNRVDVHTYMSMPQNMFSDEMKISKHFAAEFAHDDEGFLSSYRYIEYGNNEKTEEIIHMQDFDVKLKRKV